MHRQGTALATLMLAVSFLLAADQPAAPIPVPDSPERLAADIDAHLTELESSGLAGVVLLTKNGKDLLFKAYGMADRENGRVMTVDSVHCIGSIVKPITLAAVVTLEADGRIGLDDTLPKFFDRVSPDKADITIRQLIEHKAGLPDIFGDDYDLVGKEWVVDKALTTPLIAKPGEKEEYSNCGYTLLGAIIEKVSGREYEKFVNAEILAPTGTPRIGYTLPGWKIDQLAVGYENGRRWGTTFDRGWLPDGPGWNLRCNGGMLATARDLHRLFDALFGGRVLSPEATRRYREFRVRSLASGKKITGMIGGNEISNAVYVNVLDDDLVFILFTSVDAFKAKEVLDKFKPRLFGS